MDESERIARAVALLDKVLAVHKDSVRTHRVGCELAHVDCLAGEVRHILTFEPEGDDEDEHGARVLPDAAPAMAACDASRGAADAAGDAGFSGSHPACWTGHGYEHTACVVLSGRRCVDCGAPAGTLWSPYWCPPCDVKRLDRISVGLEGIHAEVEGAPR